MSAVDDAPAVETRGSRARGPRRFGRVMLLVAAVLIVVFGALAVWAAGTSTRSDGHLRSPDDPSPQGAMALAEVLRAEGVDVVMTGSFPETTRALAAGGEATLLIDDDWWILTEEAAEDLRWYAERVVVVQPSDAVLEGLAPGVEYAGFGGGVSEADCTVPEAERAGRIDTSGEQYTAPGGAESCFPVDRGEGNALVRLEGEGPSVTVLGAADVLSNAAITDEGAAALALGLLGGTETLVWYQPDIDDYALDASGLSGRQADWYVPLIVLALLVGIAAIVWRGRRMGPVVVEQLPVEVRASETMDGRARLYATGGAQAHALATLRTATVARLARTLALPSTASVDDVVRASAAIAGRDPASVHALLVSARARDDRALVQLSDELLGLERDVARGITPR